MYPSTQAFLAAMAAGEDWPQVFGGGRELTARHLAAVLRAQRPTKDERLLAALTNQTGPRRRVATWDNGTRWFKQNYYEHAALLDA